MTLTDLGPYVGLLISAMTTATFMGIAKLMERTRITEPASASDNEYLSWKWRNFLISFCHATIAGLATLYCVINQPSLLSNMISTESQAAYLLSCFSNGYFVYDLFEMKKCNYKGSFELIIHHVLVICCLTIAIWYNLYLGYSCVALIVELNNIFLHFRQLLNIAKVPKTTSIYRINCWVNLCSFVVFRMFTLFWLGKCLYEHYPIIPFVIHATASTCLIAVSFMTTVMFYRIVQADFFPPESEKGESNGILKNGKLSENNKENSKPETNGSSMTVLDELVESKAQLAANSHLSTLNGTKTKAA